MKRAPASSNPTLRDLTILDPSGLHRHIGFMLRLATAAVLRDFARAMNQFDLRPGEYACLLVVGAEPGLNQQRIGQIISVKHSNLVAIVNSLESRGLIDRARPTRDRRTNSVYLTRAGAQCLKRLERVVEEHRQRLLRKVGRRNHAALLRSLSVLATME